MALCAGEWTVCTWLFGNELLLIVATWHVLEKLLARLKQPCRGLSCDAQPVAEWEYLMHELRRWRIEFNKDAPPFKWRDPNADFNNHFSKWYHQQPDRFKQRLLTPDQARPNPHLINASPVDWLTSGT